MYMGCFYHRLVTGPIASSFLIKHSHQVKDCAVMFFLDLFNFYNLQDKSNLKEQSHEIFCIQFFIKQPHLVPVEVS